MNKKVKHIADAGGSGEFSTGFKQLLPLDGSGNCLFFQSGLVGPYELTGASLVKGIVCLPQAD